MANLKSHCKYCGARTQDKVYICGKCSDKLPLVRKLLRIGKLIKEAGRNGKKK